MRQLELPDPGRARTLGELIEQLRLLKAWAGDPSYDTIKDRINVAWTAPGRPAGELAKKATVVDCFKTGRRRLNTELVLAVVQALHPDTGYQAQWRQALRVITAEMGAAGQVRAQDTLPQDLPTFAGRTPELGRLRQLLHDAAGDEAVVISAIEGMAGVGKTQLAIHAGHLLAAEQPFERVLFVNLRGFHPDPAQPPADPGAVLDSFLRLLGVPGQLIPHDLPARTALYRQHLAGRRALVVLDNAANETQVTPLLPGSPDCVTLITSRRHLTNLHPASHLPIDVFTPAEAVDFLTRTGPEVATGDDPLAAARLAQRCGHLPLALGLLAGHIRTKPGWTLTDHADRLDQRHRDGRLDTGVELALGLSYQHLPVERQRLFRVLALHPGHDVDSYAAAALAEVDPDTAEFQLRHLCDDHLLQQGVPGRFVFHDLVRAYANDRADDEDRPPAHRAALTRLFDYYLATAAAAMDSLHPAEAHRGAYLPVPVTPVQTLTDPDTALAWLDTERSNLVAVAAHTAAHGWPTHTVGLSVTLFRYLTGGHPTDGLAIHGHARHAARRAGDQAGQAQALNNLGTIFWQLGQYKPATDHYDQALTLYQQLGDWPGQARVLSNLGVVEERLGRYSAAADHHGQALALHRQSGPGLGEAAVLAGLGVVEERLGRYGPAADHLRQALILAQHTGDRSSEARVLTNLGVVEERLGQPGPATDHLHQALAMFRQLGDRYGEAQTLDNLGTVHTRCGRPNEAAGYHRQALDLIREIGARDAEAWILNGLGEAEHTGGNHTDALTHHTTALATATATDTRDQQARAHAGLARAHHRLHDSTLARHHYTHALAIFTDLGVPDADEISADLSALDG